MTVHLPISLSALAAQLDTTEALIEVVYDAIVHQTRATEAAEDCDSADCYAQLEHLVYQLAQINHPLATEHLARVVEYCFTVGFAVVDKSVAFRRRLSVPQTAPWWTAFHASSALARLTALIEAHSFEPGFAAFIPRVQDWSERLPKDTVACDKIRKRLDHLMTVLTGEVKLVVANGSAICHFCGHHDFLPRWGRPTIWAGGLPRKMASKGPGYPWAFATSLVEPFTIRRPD